MSAFFYPTTTGQIYHDQLYIVPFGLALLRVICIGGTGQGPGSARGGRVFCVIPVTGGETLIFRFGGGGVPLDGNSGGGVASIFRGVVPLVIAGGGGAGGGRAITSGSHGGYGGAGGGLIGGAGGGSSVTYGGGGGTQAEGGVAGDAGAPGGVTGGDGLPGLQFYGGRGGNGEGTLNGGGGGGGWYGGGGGSLGITGIRAVTGGGGGSSYTAPDVTGISHSQGWPNGFQSIEVLSVDGSLNLRSISTLTLSVVPNVVVASYWGSRTRFVDIYNPPLIVR